MNTESSYWWFETQWLSCDVNIMWYADVCILKLANDISFQGSITHMSVTVNHNSFHPVITSNQIKFPLSQHYIVCICVCVLNGICTSRNNSTVYEIAILMRTDWTSSMMVHNIFRHKWHHESCYWLRHGYSDQSNNTRAYRIMHCTINKAWDIVFVFLSLPLQCFEQERIL